MLESSRIFPWTTAAVFFATSIITTLISLSRILSLSFFSHFTVTVFVVVFVFGDVRGGRDLPVDERGGFCDSYYHHLIFLHLSLSLTLYLSLYLSLSYLVLY